MLWVENLLCVLKKFFRVAFLSRYVLFLLTTPYKQPEAEI